MTKVVACFPRNPRERLSARWSSTVVRSHGSSWTQCWDKNDSVLLIPNCLHGTCRDCDMPEGHGKKKQRSGGGPWTRRAFKFGVWEPAGASASQTQPGTHDISCAHSGSPTGVSEKSFETLETSRVFSSKHHEVASACEWKWLFIFSPMISVNRRSVSPANWLNFPPCPHARSGPGVDSPALSTSVALPSKVCHGRNDLHSMIGNKTANEILLKACLRSHGDMKGKRQRKEKEAKQTNF